MSLQSSSTEYTLRPISGSWRRWFAYVVDTLILTGIGFLIGTVWGERLAWVSPLWTRLVGSLLIVVYLSVLNSRVGSGQTVGKRFLGVRVVDVNGNCISLLRSIVRALLLQVPAILITISSQVGYRHHFAAALAIGLIPISISSLFVLLYIFNSTTRQSLHDLLCGTYVVEAWTRGIVKVGHPTSKLITTCVLVSILFAGIPGLLLYGVSHRLDLFGQANAEEPHLEIADALELVEGIISAQAVRYTEGEFGVQISYAGKKTANDIATEAAALIQKHFPSASLTINTSKGYDLVIVRSAELATFRVESGKSLELVNMNMGFNFGSHM